MRKSLFIMLFALSSGSLISQAATGKNGISFKGLLMDYQSQNGGNFDAIKDYQAGFEIGYHRFLANKLYLNVPIKVGNINREKINVLDGVNRKIVGGDLKLNYNLKNIDAKINPYILAGVGGVQEIGGNFNVQVPGGLGVNFMVSPQMFINVQSEFRYSLADDRNNFHHGVGFVYFLGGKNLPKLEIEGDKMDSDGDGVVDKLDLCPDVPGLAMFNGCPDSDGDGVPDFQDVCPKVAGLKSMKGCPDTDGDGVADNEDQCPTVAGTIANKGCPEKVVDTDGDGVPDSDDKCPNIAGTKANNGCPEAKSINDTDGDGVPDNMDKCPDVPGPKVYDGCPDTDGDGIPDNLDKCPRTPGTVASNGCPDITKEDRKTLDVAMRAVQFETGKSTFKPESFGILKQIGSILSRYPDYNLAISGHTDNVGSAIANQDLSERRAKACYDYLSTQGVNKLRMSSAGYGESRPVTSNDTEVGRTLNRRVEFAMIPK